MCEICFFFLAMLCCVVYICLAVSNAQFVCSQRALLFAWMCVYYYYCSRGIPRQDCSTYCPIVLEDKFCGT